MGKYAQYMKRGTASQGGIMAAPGPAPTDFTAVTGGVGVITVARVAPVPTGATQMLWRALDTTTNVFANAGNNTLTGLVSGRAYKVFAIWFNVATQVSDLSPPITVNAG